MPFRSNQQRKFLWAVHPDIARRWADEFPGGSKNLPEYANSAPKDNKDKETAAKASILSPPPPPTTKEAVQFSKVVRTELQRAKERQEYASALREYNNSLAQANLQNVISNATGNSEFAASDIVSRMLGNESAEANLTSSVNDPNSSTPNILEALGITSGTTDNANKAMDSFAGNNSILRGNPGLNSTNSPANLFVGNGLNPPNISNPNISNTTAGMNPNNQNSPNSFFVGNGLNSNTQGNVTSPGVASGIANGMSQGMQGMSGMNQNQNGQGNVTTQQGNGQGNVMNQQGNVMNQQGNVMNQQGNVTGNTKGLIPPSLQKKPISTLSYLSSPSFLSTTNALLQKSRMNSMVPAPMGSQPPSPIASFPGLTGGAPSAPANTQKPPQQNTNGIGSNTLGSNSLNPIGRLGSLTSENGKLDAKQNIGSTGFGNAPNTPKGTSAI